MYQIEVYNQSL